MSNDRVSKFASNNTSAVQEDDFDAMFNDQDAENRSFRSRKQQNRPKNEENRGEVTPIPVDPKKKGRPKKGAVLDLNIGINVFLDKPLHKKLQFTKAETDIGIKDLIYMATDYVMNELFDNGVPNREGERVIREFKEKMFGIEE